MGCNRLEEALRIIYASMTPVAFAALALLTYQSPLLLFGVVTSYVVWGWHKISRPPKKVCSPELWRYTSWLYAAGFMAAAPTYLYIGGLLYAPYGHILHMPLERLALLY